MRISRSIIRSVKFKAKGKMQVSWRKNTKVTGYQIKYVSGSKVRTVTVKGSRKVSRVITGLKKGKQYKIYVRAYKKIGSKKYYSSWSKVKRYRAK